MNTNHVFILLFSSCDADHVTDNHGKRAKLAQIPPNIGNQQNASIIISMTCMDNLHPMYNIKMQIYDVV